MIDWSPGSIVVWQSPAAEHKLILCKKYQIKCYLITCRQENCIKLRKNVYIKYTASHQTKIFSADVCCLLLLCYDR